MDSTSPPSRKRVKRGRVDVKIASVKQDAAAESTTPHAATTNPIVKGLIQESIDGILLQTALDAIRISSTVFLHRFLADLSRQRDDEAMSTVASTSVTTKNTGNVAEEERALLQSMRHLVSTHPDYQFLEGVLDERWEEQCVASQTKRKSTLLSDIPRGPVPAKKSEPHLSVKKKKAPSSKNVALKASALLVPASFEPTASRVELAEGRNLPGVTTQEVVWDQEDYD